MKSTFVGNIQKTGGEYLSKLKGVAMYKPEHFVCNFINHYE